MTPQGTGALPAAPAGCLRAQNREGETEKMTAARRSEEFRGVLDAHLRQTSAQLGSTEVGLYLHVPFCSQRCAYCGFNTYTVAAAGGLQAIPQFVASAISEIHLAGSHLAGRAPPLRSVYFGGGTPSLLGGPGLAALLHTVLDRFPTVPHPEVTVEANPGSLDPGELSLLAASGVTRLSIGLQSASPKVLAELDRAHSPRMAIETAFAALEAGIPHVNLDLIYGAAGETPDDWHRSLEAALSAPIDHLSAYCLSIEPGTALAARVRSGRTAEPDPDQMASRYEHANSLLEKAGFEWYELSNWARTPEARCEHNELYWQNRNWWGIGPGAHSHLSGLRWWNHDDPSSWAESLSDCSLPCHGFEVLDEAQRQLESVLLGIRRSEGLAVEGLDGAATRSEVQAGRAVVEGDRLRLTMRGRLQADAVVRRLVGHG